MRIDETKYSIAEIAHWVKTRELIVNTAYQRGAGLWPVSAKSYFVDTVLRGFPFPKIYFYESVDKTARKPKREIVDGQQRIGTLIEFLEDKFPLSDNASEFTGMRFSDLDDEHQEAFYSYTVSVDVIRNADPTNILQMFRRMNAYTLPLNGAEKRHAEFTGEFTNWVNTILDEYGSILVEWEVLTSRQIVRLADTELIADLALAVEQGVINTTPKKLADLYKQNERVFKGSKRCSEMIGGAFSFMRSSLPFVKETTLTKPHVFHSLTCALMQNMWGLPDGAETLKLHPIGKFAEQGEAVRVGLLRLAEAHEAKDSAMYADYVEAASAGGNRAAQRIVRIRSLCAALRGELA